MGLESIGKNIRKFRVANHLRLEDLAEKVGLSVNYVGALERGEKLPSLETFINIANWHVAIGAPAVIYMSFGTNQEGKHEESQKCL